MTTEDRLTPTAAGPAPQQRIEAEVKSALKSGDKDRLGTLRMLLTDIKNERIRRGGEVDEAGFTVLVRRAIKQREEARAQYQAGGRPELAAKEEGEAAILGGFLPAAPADADIRAAIAAFIAERGLAGPSSVGPIMKEMLARFGSAADGGTINRIARELLGAGAPR
jgi:uncharacterized protein YqeY